MMESEKRDVEIMFWVTPTESRLIQSKMEAMGTKNRSAYLRKVALDGYIIRLDLPELKEIVTLMKRTSNNVNQLARCANESGRIYEVDVREICENQKKLWEGLHAVLKKMSMVA